jgi:hypothetical protein
MKSDNWGNDMSTNEHRPVHPMLVSGAAALVMAGLLVLQHFLPFSPGSLCRILLFPAFMIG